MAKIIQNTKVKIEGRIFRCIGIWWKGNTNGKGSIKDSYEFVEHFDEPQPVDILIRDADYIDSLVLTKKIKIL